MKFVADESVDRPIVERLRRDGHTVIYIAESEPGWTDERVLAEATARDALLLTADKDFDELVFRLGRVNQGILLLRLAGLSADAKESAVGNAVRRHAEEFRGRFSVVLPGNVRIR